MNTNVHLLVRHTLNWQTQGRKRLFLQQDFPLDHGHLHGSRLLTCEDGTDTLSRNVGKHLPQDAT
jgi:hypothetical protein